MTIQTDTFIIAKYYKSSPCLFLSLTTHTHTHTHTHIYVKRYSKHHQTFIFLLGRLSYWMPLYLSLWFLLKMVQTYRIICYLYLSPVLTLFRATTNGVFRFFSKLIDSMVCGSRPCIMSMTRMAISQRDDPRTRRLLSRQKSASINSSYCDVLDHIIQGNSIFQIIQV